MAEDKQAGDLYVSIQSSSQGASKSLNTIIKKLEKLQTTLKGVDTTNLSKMTQELNNASGARVGKSRGSASRSSSSGGALGFLRVARWGATIYMARRLGRVVANIAQAGADYTETLNLWETSMGNNVTLATEFVNKMNEAYGISEKTLMNAQATFKNMLGGLGNISDQMAYALSEGITQMAVDYASLYNQTFEQAFTKFQAALAGQVRPIRSVSGFDITENTLFQLYQSLGGEKTMRQLTRTEKQLLSILAIFQQMTATGAVGDLNKTMESFANQSRVMAESWQQVRSYAGSILTYLIKESKLLTYVNGLLIFLGDTFKGIAESIGAIEHFADPFQAVTDGALGADKAIDQLNGKLLDFDKFRALNESSDTNALGLDERLIEAFKNFDGILSNAKMNARDIADQFKRISGFFDENGIFDFEAFMSIFSTIAPYVSKIFKTLEKITPIITKLISIVVDNLSPALDPLLKIITDIVTFTGEVFNMLSPILNMIASTSRLLAPILEIVRAIGYVVSVVLTGALQIVLYILTPILAVFEAILKVVQTIAEVVRTLFAWDWNNLGDNLSKIWKGWEVPKLANTVGSYSAPSYFANGGLPDKGTMFVAGEAGAEIVYNTPSGQSGVANVQQIAQATYSGTIQALNDWWGGRNAKGDIPQLKEASATGMYQAVTGVAKSYGNTWKKY